ncbi:OsmC family protein [Fictibacillus aquaticus]|uniref:Peroxiredoxin n=1 Tax=Fictibacillus aquaticus TaxID=2021314 RepID=A0A235F482_9BACL|nr:OsmC family protein [Fictibacillus aquaticus]OYD56079.1 hypothetical protein CGZ90_19460 [Fictibacillus aquaticus]
MALHHFHLRADWPGLRNDVGKLECGGLKTEISIPPEMDGPGVGTNPDEMLLGAAATCFIITLAAMMERSKLVKEDLTLSSEGLVESEGGVITYKKIIHRPHITLPAGAGDKEIKLAKKLAEKAESSCMITRAIKGNVEVELETSIFVNE